jgi:hypothetical protein
MTGCNAILGIDDLSLRDAAVMADGTVDAPAVCYGTLAPGCFPAVPTGALTLTGMLDTGNDSRCSMGPSCVIGADSIIVDMLNVTGPRPLVLVAVTTLTIANKVDASSTGARLGPGANSPMCIAPGLAMLSANSGGGAGGSFSTSGGSGGRGAQTGGLGGTPGAIQTPTALRGGCPGGAGAGASVAMAGVGGNGGGALALYAGVKIKIDEDVRVSGGGGVAGQTGNAGGGGGGSGGMIVLEATMIDVGNDLFANGGGGGEGASLTAPGMNGAESTDYNNPANGGGGNSGGDGGDGFALAMIPQDGMTMGAGGGGGGGGGAGVIWVKGTVTGTKISPAAIPR